MDITLLEIIRYLHILLVLPLLTSVRNSDDGINIRARCLFPTQNPPTNNIQAASCRTAQRSTHTTQYYQDTMPTPAADRLIQLKGIAEIFVALILTVNPQLIYDSPVTHKLSRLSGLVSLLLSSPFP